MDKVINLFKNKGKIIFSIITNILCLIVYMCMFKPAYEINDDMPMYLLSVGAFGESNPYMIFSHYLLGTIQQGLLLITDSIKWYSLMQYAFVLIAFICMGYLLLEKWGYIKGAVYILIINVIVGYQAYVRPQFTKVAAIVTITGIVFFYYYYKNEGLKKKAILGAVLALFGSLYRFDMALIVGVIFAAWAVVDNISLYNKEQRKICFKMEYKRVVALLVLAASMLLLYASDGLLYRDEWKSYKKWQRNMAMLTDYGAPDYYQNIELYQILGITEFDMIYYMTFNMGDREQLTDENVQKLVDAKTPRDKSFYANKDIYLEVLKNIRMGIFGLNIIIILSGYYLLFGNGKTRIAIIFNAFTFLLIYYAFTVFSRVFINRVDIGLVYAMLVCMLSFCEYAEYPLFKKKGIFYLQIALSSVFLIYAVKVLDVPAKLSENAQIAELNEMRAGYRALFRELAANSENVYITSIQGMGGELLNAYGVFDVAKEGELKNIYVNGGWCSGAPSSTVVLNNYGIDNGFEDVINCDYAYIVEESTDNDYFKYVRENYTDGNIIIEECGTIGKWHLYQIKTE